MTLLFIFTFIFTVAVTVNLSSCQSQSEKDWDKIKDNGTIEELMDFAVNLTEKDDKLFNQASKKIKNKINTEENPEKLNNFISQYSYWEIDFKDRISELALNHALEKNTVDSLEKYINDFFDYSQSDKNTEYINQAKNALRTLCFNIAKEQKSVGLLEEFIYKYGGEDSILADEAINIIKEIKDKLNWDDVLEKYKAESSLLPLLDFTETYPDSVYISEAEELIKQIRNDSSYSKKYFDDPDLDSINEFILNFPGHKNMNKALKIREDFIGDIYSMLQKEYIGVLITGDSITQSRIIGANLTKSRLEVSIPYGAYLAANSGYVQNMLIREEITFSVEPLKYWNLHIDTACMNIYRDIPDENSYFTIDRLDEDSPLIKLLKLIEENKSSYEVTQAAIWYITDNPGKDVILNTLIYDDQTNAITEKDYAEAMRLVELALK